MNRQLKHLCWITLWGGLIGLPVFTHAAEAPGALTFIVKDQNTDRPLSKVQITLKQRESSAAQTLETDEQGRILVESLEPGLYSVDVAKSGFASLNAPSVRVVTRKTIKIEFELKQHSIEVVEVRGRQSDVFASGSSTLNRPDFLRQFVAS
jgi:5-hydroxyisourate hydrolase-like protein (transthyretin family)